MVAAVLTSNNLRQVVHTHVHASAGRSDLLVA